MSGVIYGVIVVMWAAYFIPRWLRRHEELSESRSVEKFSAAMRILSRREPTPDQRYVVMPPRPDEPRNRRRSRRRSRTTRPEVSISRHNSVGRNNALARHNALTLRRRRILVSLLALTLLAALLTPVTAVPWWAVVILAVLTVVDIVHLRVQARRQRELRRARQAVRRRTRARLRRLDSAERIVAARRSVEEERAAAESAAAEAEESGRLAANDDGWRPTPVPLPTYVSKPKATRVARTVDLSEPGTWSELVSGPAPLLEEEPFDQTAASTAAPAPALLEEDSADLEAIIERRRAVND